MKLRHILKELISPLPPAVQHAPGLQRDQDFNPPEAGVLERLFGIGSDGRVYTVSAADQRRLRPILLRDERALRNEAIARERAKRRGDTPLPVNFAQDAPKIDGNQGASAEAAFPDVPDGIRRMLLRRDPSGFMGYGAGPGSFVRSRKPGDIERE